MKKYHLYLTSEERILILKSLIGLKNQLSKQGKYTDGVDEIIPKIIGAKQKNLKIKYI
ncbi:hypothetical protein [Copranaerobaculum intestinale]|uniref:hypothetical protein n=1 Tax=Copranaerobaculum intestinale TaxID=2692629 RepID=UPI00201C2794|nr:hypothetical protein [Copranaerobaculum intestinale]